MKRSTFTTSPSASTPSRRSPASIWRSDPASWSRCSVRPARARPRCCGSSPASNGRTRARCCSTARMRSRAASASGNVGFVFQHYALFRHLTVFENVAFGLRVRPRGQRLPEARDPTSASRNCSIWSNCAGWRIDIPISCPAASGSASRWRGRSRSSRACLLLDEPFGALDAKVRKELRRWLRSLHEEIHVTSLFVTHDQEEALEVADRVVVMDGGRIEQIGTPQEVYERPATAFVHEFIGESITLPVARPGRDHSFWWTSDRPCCGRHPQRRSETRGASLRDGGRAAARRAVQGNSEAGPRARLRAADRGIARASRRRGGNRRASATKFRSRPGDRFGATAISRVSRRLGSVLLRRAAKAGVGRRPFAWMLQTVGAPDVRDDSVNRDDVSR